MYSKSVTSGGFERDKGAICEESRSQVEDGSLRNKEMLGLTRWARKESRDEFKAAL